MGTTKLQMGLTVGNENKRSLERGSVEEFPHHDFFTTYYTCAIHCLLTGINVLQNLEVTRLKHKKFIAVLNSCRCFCKSPCATTWRLEFHWTSLNKMKLFWDLIIFSSPNKLCVYLFYFLKIILVYSNAWSFKNVFMNRLTFTYIFCHVFQNPASPSICGQKWCMSLTIAKR